MPARTPCPKGKATIPSTFKGGGEEQSRRRLSSETTRLNGSTGHPLPGNNRNAARLSSPQETNHALQSGTKPVLQSDSELFVMIGLVADNRKGPVKLLGEKGAHDLMGKGHSRKRQPTVGPLVHFR